MFLWRLNEFKYAEHSERYLLQPVLFPAHDIQMQRSKNVLKKESTDQTTSFYGQNSAWGLPACNACAGELRQASRLELVSKCASSFIGTWVPDPTLAPSLHRHLKYLLPLIQTLLLAPLIWVLPPLFPSLWPVTLDPVLIFSPRFLGPAGMSLSTLLTDSFVPLWPGLTSGCPDQQTSPSTDPADPNSGIILADAWSLSCVFWI